jgi:hypothetical protein
MKKSNITRYLCAAAQNDHNFRNQFLENILNERYRVINIPEGVDLVSIAKHCINARHRELIRNIVIAILFLIEWKICELGGSCDSNSIHDFFSTPSFPSFGKMIWDIFLPSSFLSFFFFFLVWMIIVVEVWITRYQIIAKYLLKHNFNDVISTNKSEAKIRNKFSGIIDEENSNVVIYSGFSPFIGSGENIKDWSFTLDISKSKEDVKSLQKPKIFTVEEIYSYIDSDINKLNLQEISIQDKIFVNGQCIRGDDRFLPNPVRRPLTQVSASTIEEFVGGQSDSIRYYKCIRINSWQQEVTLSVFLRFFKLHQNLFVETSYFFLPPLKEEYHKIDRIQPRPTWRQLLKIFPETFLTAIGLFQFTIFILIGNLFKSIIIWNRQRVNQHLIRENPMFDYGASTSLRELSSSDSYNHYFQKTDGEMYLKLIESQILASIINFLDAHDIDTSDLQTKQNTILNNGVIVAGGSFKTKNLSVGERATSVINNMTKAVSSLTITTSRNNQN